MNLCVYNRLFDWLKTKIVLGKHCSRFTKITVMRQIWHC